jgi:hypothetical protein
MKLIWRNKERDGIWRILLEIVLEQTIEKTRYMRARRGGVTVSGIPTSLI